MKRLFVLTADAKSDLKDILLDIAEDSPDAAERVRSEFQDALRMLGQSPGVGHWHEELLSKKYRFWNFYSYVVVCVWEVRPIQIVSVVVHGARDLAAFLNSRLGPGDSGNPQ